MRKAITTVAAELPSATQERLDVMLSDVARVCTEFFEVLHELEQNSLTSSLFGHSLAGPSTRKTPTRPRAAAAPKTTAAVAYSATTSKLPSPATNSSNHVPLSPTRVFTPISSQSTVIANNSRRSSDTEYELANESFVDANDDDDGQ
jgi:hypothetical protein